MTSSTGKVEAEFRDLVAILAPLEAKDLHAVLATLLTPQEREKIVLRWKLVCLLQQGITQRAIAAKLGVSLCKITRGSRELKFGPEAFRAVVRSVAGNKVSKG